MNIGPDYLGIILLELIFERSEGNKPCDERPIKCIFGTKAVAGLQQVYYSLTEAFTKIVKSLTFVTFALSLSFYTREK